MYVHAKDSNHTLPTCPTIFAVIHEALAAPQARPNKYLTMSDHPQNFKQRKLHPSVKLTVVFVLQKRATGDVLLREVFKHVGLDEEKEYFGLSFQDSKGQVVRIMHVDAPPPPNTHTPRNI